MNRLQAELHRLYLPHATQRHHAGPNEPGRIGSDGEVGTMVLELARPASWAGLAPVWRGVQADLELPAPAIAVSGIDGYQLWFSLLEPAPVEQALAFLESLRERYLGEVARERIAMHPGVGASTPAHADPIKALPPVEAAPGRWSAFVSPDLATLFADEPWLDLAPGPDAQADLLSRIEQTKPDAWKRALERLGPARAPGVNPTTVSDRPGPRRFLLEVMNDRAVELRLRIEAAKALLPYDESPCP